MGRRERLRDQADQFVDEHMESSQTQRVRVSIVQKAFYEWQNEDDQFQFEPDTKKARVNGVALGKAIKRRYSGVKRRMVEMEDGSGQEPVYVNVTLAGTPSI